ncbi:MAG: GspH/FimT family pseudopilin [Candidatus Methylomirabilales bacterium]
MNSTIKSSFEFRVSSSGLRVGATRWVAPPPEAPHPKRHTRNRGPSRAAGFTLLELIVVLFILILVAALVAPIFTRSFGQLRLKAATRDLATLCRFARTQAITHQAVLEVVLDRRTNSYWLRGPEWVVSRLGGIEQVATAEDPEQPWQVRMRQARVRPLPVGVTLKSVILDLGALREDERGTIVFFPQGSSTGGEVWVSDEKGRGYRIVIDPSIGLVRIHEATTA